MISGLGGGWGHMLKGSFLGPFLNLPGWCLGDGCLKVSLVPQDSDAADPATDSPLEALTSVQFSRLVMSNSS